MDLLRLKITRIDLAAGDAILVYLEEADNRPVHYEAGQFFTFLIDHHGKEVRRSYSITSTPGVDENLSVIIKRRVNGEISRYLIDHLKSGDVLTSLPPSGRFTLDIESSEERTLFFIAAGSGISPIYSLIKKALFKEPQSRVVLICQNRDETKIILKEDIESLQHRFSSRFVNINLLSNPTGKKHFPRRLNNSLLERLISAHAGPSRFREFYICGPYPLMRMSRFVLRLMGFREEQIHKEHFVIDPLPPLPPLITDTSSKVIKLRWNDDRYVFEVSYPMNILQGALNHGIRLPYSCRGGRCSTCIARCVMGKVIMSLNEVLTDKNLQEGLVLTCVGYAETDLELEL
ncbi:MAG: ferredoxin--NADP reductase [Chitinophagaceae bacterium]